MAVGSCLCSVSAEKENLLGHKLSIIERDFAAACERGFDLDSYLLLQDRTLRFSRAYFASHRDSSREELYSLSWGPFFCSFCNRLSGDYAFERQVDLFSDFLNRNLSAARAVLYNDDLVVGTQAIEDVLMFESRVYYLGENGVFRLSPYFSV